MANILDAVVFSVPSRIDVVEYFTPIVPTVLPIVPVIPIGFIIVVVEKGLGAPGDVIEEKLVVKPG